MITVKFSVSLHVWNFLQYWENHTNNKEMWLLLKSSHWGHSSVVKRVSSMPEALGSISSTECVRVDVPYSYHPANRSLADLLFCNCLLPTASFGLDFTCRKRSLSRQSRGEASSLGTHGTFSALNGLPVSGGRASEQELHTALCLVHGRPSEDHCERHRPAPVLCHPRA
jgi:hypothetical protein